MIFLFNICVLYFYTNLSFFSGCRLNFSGFLIPTNDNSLFSNMATELELMQFKFGGYPSPGSLPLCSNLLPSPSLWLLTLEAQKKPELPSVLSPATVGFGGSRASGCGCNFNNFQGLFASKFSHLMVDYSCLI